MADPNSDEQNTTSYIIFLDGSYITFLDEKLNWPLTVHYGDNNHLATIGRFNVYTVKR